MQNYLVFISSLEFLILFFSKENILSWLLLWKHMAYINTMYVIFWIIYLILQVNYYISDFKKHSLST